MIDLKNELIKGLKVLDENDRDLRTLTIFCNPNFIRGADRDIKPEILKMLNKMEKQGKISKKKKKIHCIINHPAKEFVLYSLN